MTVAYIVATSLLNLFYLLLCGKNPKHKINDKRMNKYFIGAMPSAAASVSEQEDSTSVDTSL